MTFIVKKNFHLIIVMENKLYGGQRGSLDLISKGTNLYDVVEFYTPPINKRTDFLFSYLSIPKEGLFDEK